MPKIDFGLSKILRSAFRELAHFTNMGIALGNAITVRLFPLFFGVLIAAYPFRNNGTDPHTTPYTLNDDESLLPTLNPYFDYKTEVVNLPRYKTALVPIPCSVNETSRNSTGSWINDTESRTVDDSSDNDSVLLSTPSNCFKNVTLLIDPSSETEQTSTCSKDTLGLGDETAWPCVEVLEPLLTSYSNDVTLETECTNTSMLVYMNFTHPFKGVIYPKKNLHVPLCNFLALPSSNDTEVTLELPFNSCGIKVRKMDNYSVRVLNSIIIQHHSMIQSRSDIMRNISCVLQVPFEEVRTSDYFPVGSAHRRAVPWLEVCAGSDLFPTEEFRPEGFIESALYVVVKVADRKVNKDMVVRNCVAHDRRFVSDNTNLYQMSDFHGCSNNSSLLGDFAITNETGRFSDIMSFAMIKNFSMFARGQLYISCGVNLCKNSCQLNCREDESKRLKEFSSVVSKKMVMRGPGVTTPSTLQISTEGSPRIKRSVRNAFSNIFAASRSFLSNLVNETDLKDPLTTETASETTSVFELNSEGNENPTEAEFEVNTESLTLGVETTFEHIFLNQSMLLTSTKASALKQSTDRHMDTAIKTTAKRTRFNGRVLSNRTMAEVFVFIVFCFMAASYICFLRSNMPKTKFYDL